MSAATKKTGAAKKAAPAASGPSYLDMIKQVIVGRPEDARTGVSRQTIKKELPLKFPKTKTLSDSAFANHVNKAIARGVETGSLTQAKNNGKVKLAAKEKKAPAAKKPAAAKKAPSTAAKKTTAVKKAPSTAAKKPAAKKAATPKTKSSTAAKATKPAAKKTAAAAKPKAKAAAPKTKKAVAKK